MAEDKEILLTNRWQRWGLLLSGIVVQSAGVALSSHIADRVRPAWASIVVAVTVVFPFLVLTFYVCVPFALADVVEWHRAKEGK